MIYIQIGGAILVALILVIVSLVMVEHELKPFVRRRRNK